MQASITTVSDTLMNRLVAGETPVVMKTATLSVTVAKNTGSAMSNQTFTDGNAQFRLPDWCSIAPPGINCTGSDPIGIKVK